MTTIQSLPQLVAPANQSFEPLNLATLPKDNTQAVVAAKPHLLNSDLVVLGQSHPSDAPSTPAGSALDNFSLDIDLDFDFSGIYSNGGMPATESDVENAARTVRDAPAMLEESIIKFTKVEPKIWNTANIGAFVQAVLRESYMLQSEQLLDFANKVKHCNLQRKGLREHLAKLREVKTAIGPVSGEQAATTSLNGATKSHSQNPAQNQKQSPTTTLAPPELSQDERLNVQSTINNIKSHQSERGQTKLEERMLTLDGYREDVIAAIPHMDTQELWHLAHALGGSDFMVADEINTIWEDIVEAMTPEQLVEMSTTQATAETMKACNGTNKITPIPLTLLMANAHNTVSAESPRNLLNDCREFSRVASSRYQTVRDYAHAELKEFGIDASTGSPASLLIALEELKLYKQSLKQDAVAEEVSLKTPSTQAGAPDDIDPVNGFIDAVTVNELTPELVVTGKRINTVAELDDEIGKLEDLLNSVGEDAQMANLDLQNALQKQQQLLQMMSNISKMLHETAMSIIRKIGS